jgi:hypothetical protein
MSDNYNKIIHSIRNLRPIEPSIIESIRNMTDDEKMEIIYSFNTVVATYKELIEKIEI